MSLSKGLEEVEIGQAGKTAAPPVATPPELVVYKAIAKDKVF